MGIVPEIKYIVGFLFFCSVRWPVEEWQYRLILVEVLLIISVPAMECSSYYHEACYPGVPGKKDQVPFLNAQCQLQNRTVRPSAPLAPFLESTPRSQDLLRETLPFLLTISRHPSYFRRSSLLPSNITFLYLSASS